MEPTELVDAIMDDDNIVHEVVASQEWFDANPDFMPGTPRRVRKAIMITLALPELDEK